MIDIHCHILPDFDDGASNLDEAMGMARMAVESGVTGIVATPHFPGEAQSLRRMSILLNRYDRVSREIARENLNLQLYPGAEILCLPETPQLAAKKVLPTMGDTNYILVEFHFGEPQSYMSEMLDALAQAGYLPVVAHPERYRAVQMNPRLLKFWFDQGYILQVNKGSVLGAFGARVQLTAHRMIGEGLAHVIASDAHGTDRRTPHMGALKQWAEECCDPEYARILMERNPARLVAGRGVVPSR